MVAHGAGVEANDVTCSNHATSSLRIPWCREPSARKFVAISAVFVIIATAIIVLTACLWKKQRAPDIIFFMADDMGWSDVSFHENGQIPTPNMDAMCSDAVLLDSHYVQPTCTPSRAALLSGKYPIKLGLQEYVILTGRKQALPLSHKILPQYLKELGYATHLVGKWHLGMYAKEYLPHNRGFDTFYGYYNGAGTYYDHTSSDRRKRTGFDWHLNDENVFSVRGNYTTDLITDRIKDLVKSRDPEQPMFLMISHMAPHGGKPTNLYEVDERWVMDPAIKHIRQENRTKYAGMIRALDDAFGRTVAILNEADMLQNSVILFSSDNGGPSIFDDKFKTGASNWSLRGQKFSMWEGGVRAASFFWSPLLKSQRYINKHLYHITDWLPTFFRLAGGKLEDLQSRDLDGYDIWDSINENKDSPRKDMLINYDTGGKKNFAVRRGNFKLMHGAPPVEPWYNHWYATAGDTMDNLTALQDAMKTSIAYHVVSKRPNFEDRPDDWREAGKINCTINREKASSPRGSDHAYTVDEMIMAYTVRTDKVCRKPDEEPCLFDLLDDPCELREYTGDNREKIIEELSEIAERYLRDTVAANIENISPWATKEDLPDEDADPERFGGAWMPWTNVTGANRASMRHSSLGSLRLPISAANEATDISLSMERSG